jgi:hypothetical protein
MTTTSATEHSMEALTALFEERKRFEGWLAQIDAKRATTPGHVFERVRADYAARLNGVMQQLTGRAAELQTTAATLAEQIATLFATESGRRDDRAEAELRASVGEYSDDEARDIYTRCDTEISSLESQRQVLGVELAKVQEVLTLIAPKPEPVPEPEPEPEPEPVVVAEPVVGTPVERTAELPVAQAPAPAAAAPAFDELAFLQSIVEPQPAAPRPVERAHSPIAPTAQRPAAKPDEPQQPALSGGRRPGAPGAPASPREEPSGRSALHPTLTPGTLPAFLKDMPTEQIKTLKCTECGTMNYPTEWYCERCGGELAAM